MPRRDSQAHIHRAAANVVVTVIVDILTAIASAALVEGIYEYVWKRDYGTLPFLPHVVLVGIKISSSVLATECLRPIFSRITNEPYSVLTILLVALGQTAICVAATVATKHMTRTWLVKVQEAVFGRAAITVLVVRNAINHFVKYYVDVVYGRRVASSANWGVLVGMCAALAVSLLAAHLAIGVVDWAVLADNPRQMNYKAWWRSDGKPSAIHLGKSIGRYWSWAVVGQLVWEFM